MNSAKQLQVVFFAMLLASTMIFAVRVIVVDPKVEQQQQDKMLPSSDKIIKAAAGTITPAPSQAWYHVVTLPFVGQGKDENELPKLNVIVHDLGQVDEPKNRKKHGEEVDGMHKMLDSMLNKNEMQDDKIELKKMSASVIDDDDDYASNVGKQIRDVTLSEEPIVEKDHVRMDMSIIFQNSTVDDKLAQVTLTCLANSSGNSLENWGIIKEDLFGEMMVQLDLWATVKQDLAQRFATQTDSYIRQGNLTDCLRSNYEGFEVGAKVFPGRTVVATTFEGGDGNGGAKDWGIGIGIACVAFIAMIVLFATAPSESTEESVEEERAGGNNKGYGRTRSDDVCHVDEAIMEELRQLPDDERYSILCDGTRVVNMSMNSPNNDGVYYWPDHLP